jgi:hypothetical protein
MELAHKYRRTALDTPVSGMMINGTDLANTMVWKVLCMKGTGRTINITDMANMYQMKGLTSEIGSRA